MPYAYHDLPDKFTRDYFECALWSSYDESEEPLDRNYGVEDIDDETVEDMMLDCKEFQEANAADLEIVSGAVRSAGHDFWLTRNGHGSGFWDRKYKEPEEVQQALDRLDEAAGEYGDYDLFVEDGKIHAGYTRASRARYEASQKAFSQVIENMKHRFSKKR